MARSSCSATRLWWCVTLLQAVACHNTTAVVSPPIARMSIVAVGGFAMNAGQTTPLIVTAFDSANRLLMHPNVTLTSSDINVASISASGIVSARAPGSTTISARSGLVSASATLRVVPAVPQFAQIEVGGSSTCGLTTTAALYCWGNSLAYGSSHGIPQLVDNIIGFRSVSVGRAHQCALTNAGAAYCWGDNSSGELGTGDSTSAASPVAVAGGVAFQTISAGSRSTCGVSTAGDAYCWGRNFSGELGDGSTTPHPAPAAVSGGLHFQSVSVGFDFACGLTTAGAAYCWGSNFNGQLGNAGGTTTTSTSPVAVSSGVVFRSLSVGDQHVCGVSMAGAAYCWGSNQAGSLGTGAHDGAPRTAPAPVSGGLSWRTVTAGETMTCGITTTNVVYCWGSNLYDLLGSGTPAYRSDTPAVVWGGLSFTAVSARGDHACALAGNVVYCWGGYVS